MIELDTKAAPVHDDMVFTLVIRNPFDVWKIRELIDRDLSDIVEEGLCSESSSVVTFTQHTFQGGMQNENHL